MFGFWKKLGTTTVIALCMSQAHAASYENIYGVGKLTDLSSKVLTGKVNQISSFAENGLIYSR